MESDIKEGFLCPICLKDLNSPTNLSSHFEEFHQNDGDVLHQLRSVFGKAKQKILKTSPFNETTDNAVLPNEKVFVSNGTPATGGIDVTAWETQQIGKFLYCRLKESCLKSIYYYRPFFSIIIIPCESSFYNIILMYRVTK